MRGSLLSVLMVGGKHRFMLLAPCPRTEKLDYLWCESKRPIHSLYGALSPAKGNVWLVHCWHLKLCNLFRRTSLPSLPD